MPATKSFLLFEDAGVSPSGLTRRLTVRNRSGATLGWISWYAAWRRYAFSTTAKGLIFDTACLDEISAKLVDLMEERRTTAR